VSAVEGSGYSRPFSGLLPPGELQVRRSTDFCLGDLLHISRLFLAFEFAPSFSGTLLPQEPPEGSSRGVDGPTSEGVRITGIVTDCVDQDKNLSFGFLQTNLIINLRSVSL